MAEVPVSDVLCDAVEYLSKLGANLRTRSDSLKEKKITKNKLKNSHAIQKAAAKLLLICEISKKSLENVERGMKNVLNIVNAGQEEIVSGSDSKRNASKYQYFEFDTYKLRISKKVPVKHYMSVKVLAKCMPSSMIEKYPVYCDCKLLQLRKKETNKQETIELKAEALKDKFKTKPQTAIKSKKKLHNSDSENSVNNEPVLQYKANGLTTSPFKRDEVGQPKTVVETSIHNDSDKLEKNKLDGKSSEKLIERNTEKRNERPKIRKRIVRFADESDSDNEKTESVVKENSLIQNTPSNDDDVVCISPDSLAGDTKQNTSDNEITDSANSDVSDSKTKPLIKCVSISKLLKPDIIDKVVDNIASPKKRKAPHSKPPKLLTSKETSKTTSKGNMSKISNNGDETEEFWKLKRKEVSDFKSKEFVIKVVRLPKLTKDFLIKNKLKKVTQAGKIIEEILEDSCDRDIHNKRLLLTPPPQEMEKATEEEKITEEAQQVKTSLLNESDSENSIKIIPSSNNRVKRKKVSRLSIDSEESKIKEVNENKKRALLDDSDSDSSSKISSHRSEELVKKSKENEIKNTSDCSLQSNETDRCKEIKKLAANEIDQSFVNKNALLNDSDSDDMYVLNDRNVLKNDEDLERDFEALLHSKNSNEKDETCQTLNNSDSNQLHESINNNEMPNSEPTSELNHQQDHNSDESTQSFVNKNNKRQRSSDGETPDPKKMNSDGDDAKNILLRYSSSEDEDLTSTLKNIKETLLKGDSSDEELKMQKKKLTSDKESDKSFENNSSGTDKDRESDCEKDRKKKKRKVKRTKIGASKSKARDSSTDKSDIQDDKHINGLTNLKSLLRKRRRRSRRSSNDSSASAVHTKSRGKMAKAPRICNEDILEAESASEDPSDEDVDGHEEELPTVVLSGLNGESGEHLAKDDLLGDSDTSEGKEEKDTEDSKKDTSEDSDNVKSKRRKANAISSDDEAGSSRRKKDRDLDVKLSDFEDSDDDNSETGKKKRKMKVEDSDGSSDSNDGGKKKRRRIKQVDESDMSESDNENEGRNKHGRKNIRKVMGKNQLEEATKKAARQEKERMARIAERQKMYNNLDFDESGKPDEVVLDKVVLDFDPETKEPLIQLDKGLVKKLKPHQANGIKFMWDACFESVKRIKKDKGSGCILAHCMGLGKTLQVISLTHTLLTHSELTGVHRVLVVCPLSTVLNWVNEFQMWLKNTEKNFEVDIYELSRFKQNSERAFQLQQWLDNGGVCVLGYEMFRNLSADNNKKFKKKMLKSFQQSLVDPGPDLVVCDEGHLLKNEKTSLSQSMNKVRTLRRIVLTGTPLQNNLKEYYCMVQFVKPNLLGKYNEYLNRFVNPITNGQYTDSTEHDIKIMKRRSHVLHKMLDGAVQRRDYGVLAPFLPPKHEYVLFITLTDVQVKLYQHYLDNYSRRPLPGKSSGFLFPDFQSLQRIWTHPLVLKYNSERYEIMQQKKRDKEEEEDSEGSLVDFIDDDSTPNESTTDDSSDDLSDASDDSRKKKKNKSSKKNKDKGRANTRRGTRANPVELTEPEPELVEVKNENPTEWWIKLVEEEQLDDLRNSHKLVLLFDILRQCETIGDKLLVFSQSLYSLDLIEHFLGKVDEATQEGRVDEKLGNHVGSWSPGIDYFRLDGSTSCENRSIWCKNFNREDNQRARLFLISTRAGGLGINLVAANRVVIFDVSWNPSHDVQSIFRVYRFGQKKPCYVYRFLAMGTMEEKIYERQVTKQAISKRVIDEQQIDRHYAENDLAELYKFEPEPPSPRPLPPLPKDRLFAEMLREHDKQIYKYHEHDSLLENKEEETLSEEERKAAWEDFENEKNKPPPAPFPNTWNMHNGMMGGLLAQQQQQLAYAAVAAMLRKDLPNVNEQQIRDMLPLIYNANPQMFGGYDYGLMQKMNEIYKYPQAGMMNPAMMNQVMGAAAGGVGGSSSLQYEPPWQRQHQQQQQMRLQQIMQHQNQMGAKFYAGGLGSRDPVAMALQQQRAREMLGGGGAAGGGGASDARRPRGRPPGPRVPAAPHDVVDLDSD